MAGLTAACAADVIEEPSDSEPEPDPEPEPEPEPEPAGPFASVSVATDRSCAVDAEGA